MKKYYRYIGAVVIIAAIVAVCFFIENTNGVLNQEQTTYVPVAVESIMPPETQVELPSVRETSTPAITPEVTPETVTDRPSAMPSESVEAVVAYPTEEPAEKDVNVCTLEVICSTVLNNTDRIDGEKLKLIPENGVIFQEQEVVFYEGESVFNVLVREMKKNKIHMEYANTIIYNSAYIEGINNLYEHDCGELSGWMYRVNGKFPNYGCSGYILNPGDKIEWLYTCDFGVDIGGRNVYE